MKKALILGIATLVLCALLVPALAGADEWQTVTLGPISFQLPGDWQLLEEELGLGEQEVAWYFGDEDEPSAYLVVAYAEEIAMYLDLILMDFDEDVDVLSDGTIQFLGAEGRAVSLFNRTDKAYGLFMAIEEVTPAGEDMLLVIGSIEEHYETFEPVLDQILASFTLTN